jgi:hypothetical protein
LITALATAAVSIGDQTPRPQSKGHQTGSDYRPGKALHDIPPEAVLQISSGGLFSSIMTHMAHSFVVYIGSDDTTRADIQNSNE